MQLLEFHADGTVNSYIGFYKNNPVDSGTYQINGNEMVLDIGAGPVTVDFEIVDDNHILLNTQDFFRKSSQPVPIVTPLTIDAAYIEGDIPVDRFLNYSFIADGTSDYTVYWDESVTGGGTGGGGSYTASVSCVAYSEDLATSYLNSGSGVAGVPLSSTPPAGIIYLVFYDEAMSGGTMAVQF